MKEKKVGGGKKEETEQSNKEKESGGLEIMLMSLQKNKIKKPSWI